MIFHDVQQNEEEWLQLRVGKVTASNFGCFMANDGKAFGDPAKDYALCVALELHTGNKSGNGFSNAHTERGHEQEPIARMIYEEQNFVDVSNGGFFDCGDYGDSPDGLVDDNGVLEIKSVISKTHYATLRRGKHDPSYHWQLIGHFDCTERDWVDFVSYCADFPTNKQIITHRLYRGEYELDIARLRNRRDKFLVLVNETFEAIKAA